jgi:DNA polymerase bacteriophage-type
MLWIDFETRSECDLTAAGVYNYAMHRSTEVLCMCYAFDDGDVLTWTPDQPFPQDVFRHQGPIYAHNATFERLILWYVLQTDHKLEQFVCTAAQARANCAPGSLEDIGRFSGAGMRKDHSGAALIRKCCVPPFKHTTQDLADLFAYCAQDVRAMRDVSQRLRPLSPTELADYHANERINDRGVLIDVALARAATQYSAEEANDIQNTVWEITKGMVTSVRSPVMREWVLDRLTPEQLALTEVNGKASIDKSVRANLLACDNLDPDVREVVQCADDIWSSSVAKFARLASLADEEDNRLRGAFVFAGGPATGRAASYGAQVHNLPRKTAKDPAALRQAIVRGHKLDGRVSDALKSMLRPALIAKPGYVFVTADWSAIEGRVNPWLAQSPAGEAKLDVYRAGRDPYIVNAAATFGGHYDALAAAVASEDAEAVQRRQVGKVQELSCFSAETKVLTNNGVKAIVDVITDDLLWDGQEWVTHQGVVSKGLRQTINVCGLSVTEDHLFLVKHEWLDAKTVLTSKNILTQALATGSASLPYLDARLLKPARAARVWFRFSALAARRRTQSSYTTFSKVHLRDAASALKNPQGFGEKIFTSTPTPAQTMAIDGVCSIGSPHARTDATIQMIEATQIMAGAASRFMARGKQIKQRFCGMFSLSAGGISRIWNLTESTSIKAMSRAIFGSLPSRKTAPISEGLL